ncbi:MAG: helix-turn-helix domain-containing protein [Nitrospinota bacterium]
MSKSKKLSFKQRLILLMGDEKPYAWCEKVGIKKGLFQYYWQKGNIPKYDNLLKIQQFTNCSLNWLVTGQGDQYSDSDEAILTACDKHISQIDLQITKLNKIIDRLSRYQVKLKKKSKILLH